MGTLQIILGHRAHTPVIRSFAGSSTRSCELLSFLRAWVVADDAEDDRPGYGHGCPVEVNTRDIVTRVGSRRQTFEVKPEELVSPRCDPSGD